MMPDDEWSTRQLVWRLDQLTRSVESLVAEVRDDRREHARTYLSLTRWEEARRSDQGDVAEVTRMVEQTNRRIDAMDRQRRTILGWFAAPSAAAAVTALLFALGQVGR
ncbi:MAG: hypothetical protein ACRCZP_11670 [Phycicoccus sp.]